MTKKSLIQKQRSYGTIRWPRPCVAGPGLGAPFNNPPATGSSRQHPASGSTHRATHSTSSPTYIPFVRSHASSP
jgi:hypothetical protein